MQTRRDWALTLRPRVLAVIAACAALLLYARTTAPTVLPGDSGEFQFAALGFWLAHPTGYPLYLILGGVWQHLLPIGDPACRLNLLSAFLAALTIGAAFLVCYQITRARAASLIAASALAASPLFWAQATRAEVYALNTLFVALLSLLGLRWRAEPKRWLAAAFAVTLGLSLAHHRTTLLLLPAFALLFADRLDWHQPQRLIARAAFYSVLALIPLLLYLYIPLRTAATPYAALDLSPAPPIVIYESSPRGWLGLVLGTGFTGELEFDPTAIAANLAVWNLLLAQFNPVGLILGIAGYAALLLRRQLAVASFLIVAGAAYLVFNAVYRIGDIADYYTPVYFLFAAAIAVGIASVAALVRRAGLPAANGIAAAGLAGVFLLVPVWNLFNNWSRADLSGQVETRARWQALLASDIPQGAILLTNDRDEMTPLYYFQLVEGQRPDLIGVFPQIAPGAEYANVVALTERLRESQRALYAIKPIPALELAYQIEPSGELWKINTAPFAPPQTTSRAVLADTLRVRGYSILAGRFEAAETVWVGVQYEQLQTLDRDYKFSLQLRDAAGTKVAQGNDHVPGEGEYPPSRWRVGQVLQDTFELPLAAIQPGLYQMVLVIYDAGSGEPLDEQVVGEITVGE